MGKELFVGTFVHSLSLQMLEVSENSVIGVEDGKIAFIAKSFKDLESVKTAKGFEDAKVFYHSRWDKADRAVGDTIAGESIHYSRVH
jgi:hypothetical protein